MHHQSMNIVIPIHSFVDLITNSSSELFVCNSDKSAQTVRELIVTIVRSHNQIAQQTNGEVIDEDALFTDILREPEVAKWSYAYHLFPENVRKEYEKYHERNDKMVWSSNDPTLPQNQSRYQELEKQEREIKRKLGLESPMSLYEKDKEAYDKAIAELDKKRPKIWSEYWHDSFIAQMNLFIAFLVFNQVSEKDIKRIKSLIKKTKCQNCYGYYRLDFKDNDPLSEAFDAFYTNENYDMTVAKGDVLIRSARDNSIPYELMNSIENYLSARRYHIG